MATNDNNAKMFHGVTLLVSMYEEGEEVKLTSHEFWDTKSQVEFMTKITDYGLDLDDTVELFVVVKSWRSVNNQPPVVSVEDEFNKFEEKIDDWFGENDAAFEESKKRKRKGNEYYEDEDE